MSDLPLFIDPIAVDGAGDVDDAPAPWWFVAIAVAIAALAAYYVGSYWSGPRGSSHHTFDRGRAVYEQVR